MLVLPIKKQWFDMIVSGEKKEEYREIKPYYDKRLGYLTEGQEIHIQLHSQILQTGAAF